MGRIRRFAALSILFLLVAGFVGACSDDDSMEVSPAANAAMEEPEGVSGQLSAARGIAYDSGTTGGSAGGGGDTSTTTKDGEGFSTSLGGSPDIGPSVIKTAAVDLEVDKDSLSDATREAIAIAGRHGGFVLSTATRDDRTASSTVVVRIPAESFERALAALEALGEVKSEEISGEDVGQEFVDLEARLRNLEAQETVLLRLMDRSVSVVDTIRVQRELQPVQLEIERLTGRLRYLQDQADMGTISLFLVEVGAPGHKPPTGVLARAWDRAIDVALRVVAAVIVGTGFLIPVTILAALAFLVLRMFRPKLSS